MPIFPRRRSTRSSRTSTSATSTIGPTRARTRQARQNSEIALWSRARRAAPLRIWGRRGRAQYIVGLQRRILFLSIALLLLSLLPACSQPHNASSVRARSAAATGTEEAAPSATPEAASNATPPDSTDVPAANPPALARRLLHTDPAPATGSAPPDEPIGRQAGFWLEDPTAPRAYQVNATLRYKGEHTWVYLQERTQVADAAIERVGEDFDQQIYPKVTAEIGGTAFPGTDSDTRITILLADLHGMGGYFTQIDGEPASIERTSNQRRMIYLDVSAAQPGSAAFDGNLAHEFQHLVHNAVNPDAQAWINEGMSELVRAQFTNSQLNIPAYEDHPDTPLDDWPTLGDGSSLPYYGAAESFLRYLLQHYGGVDQAGRLAAEPGDGIAEVRAYLAQGGYGVSFEDVFADWLAANLINDPSGGRFSQNDPAIGVHQIESLSLTAGVDGSVHQFGARYYAVNPGGRPLTIDFDGAATVAPLPTTAPDGGAVWWSRRGDSIDTTLTRAVDLSHVDHATLHFSSWYDIERDYDFGYLEVSTDGGATWETIKAAHSSDQNPFGIALGPAYTGASGDGKTAAWIDETADLTPYAGRQILLRFEYVTDESANRNGWAIERVSIPEIGLNASADDAGWTARGFTRLDGDLPQHFIVQVVLTGSEATVQRLQLDANNHATLFVPAGVTRAILIVSGATDLIRTPAAFHLSVQGGPAR
jgi:hypothetical protein